MNGKPTVSDRGKNEQHKHVDLGYDYNHAISEATRLWNELKQRHATRGWKYPPTQASFDHLLDAWNTHPGKALVHPLDLPDFVHVKLDKNGIEQLKEEWTKLVRKYKFREAFRQFGAVYHSVVGHHQSISVRALRKLATESNIKIEPLLTTTRTGAFGKPLSLHWPMRIDNEPFAALFGFYGDLMARHAIHITKDADVQEYFADTVRSALGNIGISVRTRGQYTTTYATSLISHLLSVGGLNTSVRQLEADNPAPLFLFDSPKPVVKANLRSLFESEGGVSYSAERNSPGSVDLHQAVLCSPATPESIPRHPRKISFRQLGSPAYLLDSPPRVLTAASLLLVRFGISSRLIPASSYRNDLDECVTRWRLMITGPDIATFRQAIGFISTRKNILLQGNM